MVDPLAEVVALLQPGAPFSKLINATGGWQVRRSEYEQPFYCVVLEGSCRLAVDGAEPMVLAPGDFVLIPSADSFTMSSLELPAVAERPVSLANGEIRLGVQCGSAFDRSLALRRGYDGFTRTRAWVSRRTSRGCHTADARRTDETLDGRAARKGSSALAFRILRPLQSGRRPCADGVSDRLAHGAREETTAAKRQRSRRRCRARRLQFREHVQRRIYAVRWAAAGAVCAGG